MCIFTMLFSLTACKGTPATKDTIEKKLQNSYWYLSLLDNTAYLKFEFHNDGVCDFMIFSKETSEQNEPTKWRYDHERKKLIIGNDDEEGMVFAYNEMGDFFDLEYENFFGFNEGFIGNIAGKFFSCDKKYEILDAEAYIYLKTIACGKGDYRGEYSKIKDPFAENIEKSKKQKDESDIEEIRSQMEIVLWENIDYWDIGAVITYNDITNMDISITEPDNVVVDSKTTEQEVRAFLETVASEVDDYAFTSKIYIANPKVIYVIENERVKVYRAALGEIPPTSYEYLN